MLNLIPILLPIALIDSLSITPLALVSLIRILAGPKKYPTALGFISGLFVSYLAMALAFLFGLSAILAQVNKWISYRWNNPEPADFAVEILLGLVILAFGLPISAKRREKSGSKDLPEQVTPWSAFTFGCMINVIGFPGAVPYFAAADQIAKANAGTLAMVLAVVFYVVVFVFPMASLVILHRLLGSRLDGFMTKSQIFFATTGSRLMKIALILLGLLMIADGVAYFLGHPLLPIGW